MGVGTAQVMETGCSGRSCPFALFCLQAVLWSELEGVRRADQALLGLS